MFGLDENDGDDAYFILIDKEIVRRAQEYAKKMKFPKDADFQDVVSQLLRVVGF